MIATREGRIERAAPFLAGALLAIPVLFARYPPMGDLAFHESLVALLRNHGDASFAPAELYALHLGQPNQLFHIAGAALAFVLPTDVACKLLVAAAVFALPVAMAHAAAHLGASRWVSFVAAPIALGWTFRWGLAPNLVALPLLVFALVAVDRLAQTPTLARAGVALACAVVVHFAHASASLVLGGASVVFALSHRPTRATILRLVPALALACLGVAYVAVADRYKAPSIRSVPTSFTPLVDKLVAIPGALAGGSERAPMWLIFALTSATVVALAWRRAHPIPRRWLVVGACTLVAYFAMPMALGGSTLVHQRFLAPALVVLALAVASPRATLAARLLATALPIATLLVTLPSFVEAHRRARDLDTLLPRIERASAVAQLDLTPRAPSTIAPIPGLAARALAERGGRLLFSFTDAPTSPLTMPPRFQWNEPVLRLTYAPLAFRPRHDLSRFRYVLVRDADLASHVVIAQAFEPEARLVGEAGEWMLFESTLPVVPLSSPDVALPSPPPEDLASRIASLRAR